MFNPPKQIVLLIIKIYQKTLSPDTGALKVFYPFGACRYYPTYSEYCYQAVSKYGVIKGVSVGVKRLLKCHPLSKGGYDPIN
ncbi:MAG: membrane protein insertion efficiency factor YidD [Candidatus Komeilibacteria bacterium]